MVTGEEEFVEELGEGYVFEVSIWAVTKFSAFLQKKYQHSLTLLEITIISI